MASQPAETEGKGAAEGREEDMPLGPAAFEGRARRVFVDHGQKGEGRQGREKCPSPSLKKGRGGGGEEGQKREERSRALSCGPGSQIRRGLKRVEWIVYRPFSMGGIKQRRATGRQTGRGRDKDSERRQDRGSETEGTEPERGGGWRREERQIPRWEQR